VAWGTLWLGWHALIGGKPHYFLTSPRRKAGIEGLRGKKLLAKMLRNENSQLFFVLIDLLVINVLEATSMV
jgi:hypothetical protein